ncbi:MAG: putative redox protein, regulator of disulfide bond formation [Elusimicrobia bacterium]|nr:MAG: putative redox protein, regulator of disulfide bond formation [Elusimicrobiota bacterium]
MPHPFPHRYETGLRWIRGREAVLTTDGAPPIEGAPPPQFDGPPERWSPEALLLSAAELCLMTTFLSVAERAKLTVADYQSKTEASLDKTPEGLAFTRVVIRVRLSVYADDVARAKDLIVKAKKFCIVSNALKVPPELETEVVTA